LLFLYYSLYKKIGLSYRIILCFFEYVAQLVEHWTFNPQVLGSNPSIFTQMIYVGEILIVTTLLFFIGMIGLVLNRKNIIIMIMSLELMLLAVNLNFIMFSIYLDDIIGQVFVLFILTIAATESALGLAILTTYNNTKHSIFIDKIKNFTYKK
jgi:NADH-quinone oxidoreductase subunit K